MGIIEDAIERLFPIDYSTKIIIDHKFKFNLIFITKEVPL